MHFLNIFSLFFLITLSGCAPTYHNMDKKSDYEYALDAIEREDYEAGYRLLESYFKPGYPANPQISRLRLKAKSLFNKKPELLTAGLDTFSVSAFAETVKRHRGIKSLAAKEEQERISFFSQINPELASEAIRNYLSYFGNTPEAIRATELKREKAIEARKQRMAILKQRLENARVSTRKLKNGATLTNVKFSGSLEPNVELGCISIDKVTNKHNPPSLVYAAVKCIKQDKHEQATDLMTTAMGFAYYDLKRLADRSTRGARKVLVVNAFSKVSAEEKKKNIRIGKAIKSSPAKVKAYCTRLKQIGPPSYKPQWAIRHGIGVYQEPRNGDYLANVDEKALWQEVLRNRCKPAK